MGTQGTGSIRGKRSKRMNQKSRPVQEQKGNQFSHFQKNLKRKKMQLFKMVEGKKKEKEKGTMYVMGRKNDR